VPHTASRVLAAAVGIFVAFEVWAAGTHAVGIAKQGYRSLTTPGYTVAAGDVDPLAYFASTGALVAARRVIPADDAYTVVVGHDLAPSARTGVSLAFRFWLPPRRYVTRQRDAQWVIAYHVPSESLKVPYTNEIGLAPDVNVVRVRAAG
jgi:hypothetical protein